MSNAFHKPVMVKEVIQCFSKTKPIQGLQPLFIDGCAGHGGHSKAILNSFPKARLLCIDRDPSMKPVLEKRLGEYSNPIHISTTSYANVSKELTLHYPNEKACGVLLDLGFNSGQVDDSSRGFSFLHDGPLDMRYDPSQGITAADLINHLDRNSLVSIFVEYSGESLRTCKHLANRICKRREQSPFESTQDFAHYVNAVLGANRQAQKSPCTTIFQALRIAVNDEFKQLDLFMETLPDILMNQGVAVFLCFHSLEIKRIKKWLRFYLDPASTWRQNHVIQDNCFTILTPSVLTPSPEEIKDNSRSRSTMLYAIQRNFYVY